MLVWLGGIPGAGKTTVLKELLAAQDGNIKRVKVSDYMLELAGLTSSGELASLSVEKRQELSLLAHQRLLELDSEDPNTLRVEDGHFTVFSGEGKEYRLVLPSDERTASRTAGLVLLESSPSNIFERLSAEASRYRERMANFGFRPDEPLEEALRKIEEYQLMERFAAFSLGQKMRVSLRSVENNGGISDCAREVG